MARRACLYCFGILVVSLRFPDGGWLNFRLELPPPPRFIPAETRPAL
mgnify:CR=1 FL=1